MQTTHITQQKESILKGLNTVADAVASTMGAKGKTVIIGSNDNKAPLRFTKDGVSVAKAINLPDPIENIGAQLVISAANKTVEETGDGTSLTSIFLQTMIQTTIKILKKESNVNKVLIELENAVNKVIKSLQEKSIKVETINDIYNIANVSSNSEQIGELFKNIYTETKSFNSLLNLEKSENFTKTYYELTKGLEFEDSGYIHPAFMTNRNTEQIIYENAFVYITDQPVKTNNKYIEQLIEKVAIQNTTPLIIIAPKFGEGIKRTCIMNKVNNDIPVALLKLPGYGYGIKKNLEDLYSFLTPLDGSDSTSRGGMVDKIIASAYSFTLMNENTPYLEQRINQLKELSQSAIEHYDQKDYNKRLHNLQGSSVLIFAGGQTPEAQSEEYDRIEDAIGAVNTALKGGYVVGGGKELLNQFEKCDNLILCDVLLRPIEQILKNANCDPDKFSEYLNLPNIGFNAKTLEDVDLLKEGIIDPTITLITALKNALSNTKLFINSSYVLFNTYKNSI